MDVKTAYLHAPIYFDIYMEQPEGYEVKSGTDTKLVCRLKKLLYGLKQSGGNWNKVLHEYFSENNFVQNPNTNGRRSTTGCCVSLTENGPLISWKTKMQPTVRWSTWR
jgi:hypothetical protein